MGCIEQKKTPLDSGNGEDFNAYEGFTGLQFLDYWALEKGILDPVERLRECEHWIAQVGLEDAANRKVAINEQRYPRDRVRGDARRASEYEDD